MTEDSGPEGSVPIENTWGLDIGTDPRPDSSGCFITDEGLVSGTGTTTSYGHSGVHSVRPSESRPEGGWVSLQKGRVSESLNTGGGGGTTRARTRVCM